MENDGLCRNHAIRIRETFGVIFHKPCFPGPVRSLRKVRYGKGCFLGVPVLLASAEYEIEGLPAWEVSTSSSGPRFVKSVKVAAGR